MINKISLILLMFSVSASAAEQYRTGAAIRVAGSDGREALLPAGTSVTILNDSLSGTLAHIGIDSDDESLPSDAWVSLADVTAMKLDLEIDAGDELSFVDDAMLGRGRGGMTYCYRGVKQYLLAHHMVKEYLPGASAWKAYGILPHYGFHLVKETPAQAKINDVCVYHGGRGGNGHIEVRVNGGWDYGYGIIPHAIRNHPFLGCFRKD